MRRRSGAALLSAMAVLGTTAGCLLPQAPPTVDAVTICGDGTTFCLAGSTFYPYGAAFYSSTSQSGIISNPAGAIALSQSQHLNTVRVVNFLPHNLQSGFTNPIAQATDDTLWLAADSFIADAQHAALHAWLDLSDFKVLLLNSCTNPYSPSVYSDWDAYVRYAAQRVNTITGANYGTDAEIAWVGFAGEPYPPGTWGPGANPAGWPASCAGSLTYTSADLTNFFAHVEATWKSYSPVPTMAGGLSYLDLPHNGIDYQAIFSNPDNDICGFKTYGGMEAWLATGVRYCSQTLHKPSLNVEWGYQRSLGDATRAADFQGQFDNNASAGVAGNFYWNAGYKSAATTYDVDDGSSAPLTFGAVVRNAP